MDLLSNKLDLCIIHRLTGLNCPGCGITRMVIALSKGEIYQAFRYNPLVFIELPIILILLALYIFKKEYRKTIEIIFMILVIIAIFYGVIRNIPMFSYLAPTKI